MTDTVLNTLQRPDVTRLGPVSAQIELLDDASRINVSQTYPAVWATLLQMCGGSAHVNWYCREGIWREELLVGQIEDEHRDERAKRIDALRRHLRASPDRRSSVVKWLYRIGHVVDPRRAGAAAVTPVLAAA